MGIEIQKYMGKSPFWTANKLVRYNRITFTQK